MIGQRDLLKRLDSLVDQDLFPHFLILVGDKGSSRTLVADHVTARLGAYKSIVGVSTAEIKEMREMALKTATRTVFIIKDADKMMQQAQNAILKITEESSEYVYIIMTISNPLSMLDPLRSRASIYNMQAYSRDDILTYVHTKHSPNEARDNIMVELCSNCADVDMLEEYEIADYFRFLVLSVNNVSKVTSGNALKISTHLAFKDGDKGYDVEFFLRTFKKYCENRMLEGDNVLHFAKGLSVTSKYLQEITIRAVNKKSTFDMWVLEIRKAWWNDA